MNRLSSYITAFFLGLNSGINYASIGATLTIYLNDYHISYALLGFLSLRLLPYSFKGLWSPVVDIIPIRLFGEGFGHRKSWLIFTQACLVICYLLLAYFDNPKEYLLAITITAIIAAILAATFDNALHGYRIEIFKKFEQSKGNSIIALSFKIGFFFSLGSGLILSQYFAWSLIFCIFAVSLIPAIIFFWFAEENRKISVNLSFKQTLKQLRRNYKSPFIALIKKPYAISIILISMFFKASDSFMDTLLVPYLLEVGFTKVQTAGYSKLTGFISYSLGTVIGGYILHKGYNILKVMIAVELFAAITNLGFITFLHTTNEFLLISLSFIESFSSSMCNIALMTFLSFFCKSTLRFTATFYAILQSLSLFNRLIISSFSGITVENFGWESFFIVSSLLSIPTIIVCVMLLIRSKKGQELFARVKELN